MLDLEEVLVPVDFSPASHLAFEQALAMVGGDRPAVILQHVVDRSLAAFVAALGYEAEDAAVARMRRQAEEGLRAMAASAGDRVEVQVLVSEGSPFYEILRVAEELAVDAIVIGRHGMRTHPESAFFGSTAERIVRGCNRMVIVLAPEG